ncbi:hypothetical protein ACQEVB_29075 [Pseudonocardia sp. CA-107938]|uniref:hypothetical protein n=1 Tax=Pseudonocardia sp. CA-107938 TaxID=3240021 RepID=UPI003D921D51
MSVLSAVRVSRRAVAGGELFHGSAPVAVGEAELRAYLLGDRMRALTGARPAGSGTVAVQGGWWYRGEWSAGTVGGTTVLVHRVVNAAEWLVWAVPLANRLFVGFEEQCRRGLAALARRIEDELRPA